METRARRSPKGDLARQRIVDAAERLFSERGLFGTSVRDVAAEVQMPTASLLHHFPTKERLYGAVLGAIADQLDQELADAIARPGAMKSRLNAVCGRFLDWVEAHPARSNLLLRELLDNPPRLEQAGQLHLKPVLLRFAGFIAEGQASGDFAPGDPVLFVIHLAGAASYFSAAKPTLERILGPKRKKGLGARHRAELSAFIERALLRRDSDATRASGTAGRSRARAPRTKEHRHR